jgi:hypothetical protein
MGQQESREWLSLQKFRVQCCVVEDVRCLKVNLNVFYLMSKKCVHGFPMRNHRFKNLGKG